MKDLDKRIERLEQYYNDLAKHNDEITKLLGDISRELKDLKREVGSVSRGATFPQNATARATISNYQNQRLIGANSPVPSYAKNAVASGKTLSTPTSSVSSILSEYNKIFEYSGNDNKIARENFANKYKVIGISCSNYVERVNSPSVPPTFDTTQSLAKAHIWLIDFKIYCLAFLNPAQGYDEQKHDFAGMKDVFNSNFKSGVYNTFRLISPAVMQNIGGVWKVTKKGEIMV